MGALLSGRKASCRLLALPKSPPSRRKVSTTPFGSGSIAPPRRCANVSSAWIKDQRVTVKDGKAAEYQVNMEITFVLDD